MTNRCLGAAIAVLFLASAQTARASADPVETDAQARRERIVGSWLVIDDNTGARFLGTYTGGLRLGTVQFTTPFSNTSQTHGEWTRTGPRTFADTDSAFIFGADGNAAMIITFRAEIEVTGDTGTFEFALDVRDFAGTLLDQGRSSGTGTRIRAEPLNGE